MSGELGRWRATYTPGEWLLLCGPAAAVVLEPADSTWSDLVETLWDEVVSADSIGDLASRLAWYRIDTMPSFAAFFWGPDGMRSLVRGSISVVDADSGDVVATGEGVQTWVETGLGELRQVRVELPAGRPEGAFALPLVVGVVGVSTVFLDATDEATTPGAAPQDEPAESDVAAVPEDRTTRTAHENADTRWVPIPELAPAEPAPATVEPAAPVRAVLRASNGDVVEVVGSALVGRAPSPDKARMEHPELLVLNSPSHDISRTHLEVFVADWEVFVTDLHSTNGTVLIGPDGSRRVLTPGETTRVEFRSAVELAEGISVLIDFPQ